MASKTELFSATSDRPEKSEPQVKGELQRAQSKIFEVIFVCEKRFHDRTATCKRTAIVIGRQLYYNFA